jgi:hypothetical protein
MVIDPEPTQLLKMLLAALASNGRDPVLIQRSQIIAWPPPFVHALVETSLLRPAGSAQVMVCPGCDDACPMHVYFETHPVTGNSRAFIVCDRRDDMGLVALDPSELRQWQISRRQLAHFLVRELSLTGEAVSADGPAIALGWASSKHGRRQVWLQFEAAPQVCLDNCNILVDQLITWNGSAIAVDQETFRLIADQRPQAPRHPGNTARRDARKLDTRDRHLRWQKAYRRLKQEHPEWSDEAIAVLIAESDPGPKRKPGTVRRYMKP